MPFFSIIIPVYNVAPYLRECLDSVLAQTFTDWEAICVDDGSTDGSGAILDEYAARDKRFRIIHKKNEGVSAARNIALDIAQGEWLTFIDADDWIDSCCFEKLLKCAMQRNVGIAISCIRRVFGASDYVDVGPMAWGMFAPEELYVRYNALCTWSWGKIFKRSIWNGLRYPQGIAYSEDRYILHEILYALPEIAVVGEALYFYRCRSGSAYCSSWNIKWLQRRLAYDCQIDFFSRHGYWRAKFFTVGLYFRCVGSDICNLVKYCPNNTALIGQVRSEFRERFERYWAEFVAIQHVERWLDIGLCGDLRYLIELALRAASTPPSYMHVWWILRYDGIAPLMKKITSRMSCRRKITN